MKIVMFQGGLGNQLFQYEFYRWLSSTVDSKRIYAYYPKKALSSHNGLEIDDCFDVKLPPSTFWATTIVKFFKVLRRLNLPCRFIANARKFSLNAVLFEDYWQDLRYFTDTNFDVKVPSDYWDRNSEIYNLLQTQNTVSIHVRRGDYLTGENPQIYGEICTPDYYNKAVKLMNNTVENPHYLIFSDDIIWVKENITIENMHIIEINRGKDSYLDMYLMSKCHHNIIANSTFGWWGAYLNKNPNKIVVAPAKWYKSKHEQPNIFPSNWVRL